MPTLPREPVPSESAPLKLAPRELARRARALGAIGWSSFLAACVGCMFFFEFIAPDELLNSIPEADHFDRLGVYTLGFFGLWCLSALSAALALYIFEHVDPQGGTEP